jgi:hypothetical protein
LGIPEDVIQVEITPAFEDQVGEEAIAAVKSTKDEIAAGTKDVPFVPQ